MSEQQNQNYGAALARMAAQQGVDAALNHDLVSLQVILQDVAGNPGVVLATIHDVENNLLVQAGDAGLARNTDVPLSTHTAPITLHDSVAGYVTVSVSAANSHRGLVLSAVVVIALLLALIGGLSLYENRAEAFVRRERPWSWQKKFASNAEPASDSEDPVAEPPIEDVTYQVSAHMQVANLPSLRQQLTAARLHATTSSLDQLLDDVLALYNGYVEPLDEEGNYLLVFESTESEAEAAFRATCSVQLAARLAAQLSPMRVSLAAAIGTGDVAKPDAVAIQRERIVLEEALASTDLLRQRLALAPSTRPGAWALQDFNQPFAALLERQYEQLRGLVS